MCEGEPRPGPWKGWACRERWCHRRVEEEGWEALGKLGGVRDQAMHGGMRLVGARVARADVVGAVLRGHVDAELGSALAQVHVEVGADLPVGVKEQPLRLRGEKDRLDLVRIVRLPESGER